MEGVSIVIPCYNAAKYIREALQSVLDQHYDGPLEVLVGEDGSTDDSREIVASFGPPVQLLRDPEGLNRGMAAARNRCLRAATQPFVAFLDADDYWLPGHLSALAAALAAQPELGLVYDKGYDVTANGRIMCPRFPESHRPRTRPEDLILDCCIGTGNVMVRRAVFDRVGLFDETLRNSADHDMWLRILEAFPAAHVPAYGFCYRFHSDQCSLTPRLWLVAGVRVLEKARQRYPYPASVVRKRKAVLSYHFSEIAFRERQLVRAGIHLGKAAMLDPLRAARELWRLLRIGIGRPPAEHGT